jgi:predicted small integral membrane protein
MPSTYTLKAILVASMATFFSLIVFNNVTDFSTNQWCVKLVLSMEEIHSKQVLWRAVDNPLLQNIAYLLIILTEAVIAIIFWIAAFRLFLYQRGKQLALAGLTLGFVLFIVGFLAIGAEWFYLWQHPVLASLPEKAAILAILILCCMIYLSLNDFPKNS